MTAEEFKLFSHNKLIYLDGATGSNLMKRGMSEIGRASCRERV